MNLLVRLEHCQSIKQFQDLVQTVTKCVPDIIEDAENDLPGSFRQLISRLTEHLKTLNLQVTELVTIPLGQYDNQLLNAGGPEGIELYRNHP